MKNERLLNAIGKIDDDMISNAIHDTKAKKKHSWVKWGAMAACLCLVFCALTIIHFNDKSHNQGTGDLAPMVFIDNTLYQIAANQPDLTEKESEFIYLGEIKSRVDSSQEPKENFQTNDAIVGAKVYKYRENIVVIMDENYWLYESIDKK